MKKTIIDLFESSVARYGAKTFLLEKRHRKFEPTTYAETREQALEVGAGGRAGHPPRGQGGDPLRRGAMHGSPPNWGSSTPGRSACRSRSSSRSRTTCSSACAMPRSGRSSSRNTSCRRSAASATRFRGGAHHRLRAPAPRSGRNGARDPPAAGTRLPGGKHREEFMAIGRSIRNDDYATITYTSGTTADPKGWC